MPLFPDQAPSMAGPPGVPAGPAMTPPPMMGGGMQDMIGMMAMKQAMEPSSDMIRRALTILDDARKRDEKVAPIVSTAMDILRNGSSDSEREPSGARANLNRSSIANR